MAGGLSGDPMNIHLTCHLDAEAMVLLRSLSNRMDLTLHRTEKIMLDTQALVAVAARLKKDNTDIIAMLLAGRDANVTLAAKLKEVQDQLAALPGDTSAQEAVIASVVADLTQQAVDTETAVAANPAVPDLPPAPSA